MVGFRWLQLYLRAWALFLYALAAPNRVAYPIGNTGHRDFHPSEPGLQGHSGIFCSTCAVSIGLHALLLSLLAFLLQPSLRTRVSLLVLSCCSVGRTERAQQSIPLPCRERSPCSWSQSRGVHSRLSKGERDEEREFSLKAQTPTAVGET